jgi:hypothetical protein
MWLTAVLDWFTGNNRCWPAESVPGLAIGNPAIPSFANLDLDLPDHFQNGILHQPR